MKQKIQMCEVCDSATDRCEDDALVIEDKDQGRLVVCESCFASAVVEAQFRAEVERIHMDFENREAACCPEDVGFEEFIAALKQQNERLKGLLREWRETKINASDFCCDLLKRTDKELGQ
jgi:hypothetical protein